MDYFYSYYDKISQSYISEKDNEDNKKPAWMQEIQNARNKPNPVDKLQKKPEIKQEPPSRSPTWEQPAHTPPKVGPLG